MADRPTQNDPRPIGLQRTAVFRDVAVTGSASLKDVDTAFLLSDFFMANTVIREFDFAQPSGTSLPLWLTTQDTSASGSPTLDYVNDAAGGEFQLLTDNTDEAQNITLYGGDNLFATVKVGLVFEARIKIDADTVPLSADERLVCGLASNRNATLDNVATNAWFRIEGGSANILWETDDGTTDDDDNDTGVDFADDTYLLLRIHVVALDDVRFYVNGAHVGTGDLTDAAGNGVQPFIEFQKDAGTETEDVRVDFVRVVWPRG